MVLHRSMSHRLRRELDFLEVIAQQLAAKPDNAEICMASKGKQKWGLENGTCPLILFDEFWVNLSFSLFWGGNWHFSNLIILDVLTIFLHRINGLLLTYDMMIFFSGKSSGLRFFLFSYFQQILRFQYFIFREFMTYRTIR